MGSEIYTGARPSKDLFIVLTVITNLVILSLFVCIYTRRGPSWDLKFCLFFAALLLLVLENPLLSSGVLLETGCYEALKSAARGLEESAKI